MAAVRAEPTLELSPTDVVRHMHLHERRYPCVAVRAMMEFVRCGARRELVIEGQSMPVYSSGPARLHFVEAGAEGNRATTALEADRSFFRCKMPVGSA